mmetsp:Transcript_19693/g.25959  ORF Transcript_19693/g.25959 Transcript_19693/m.25959 type:complete len:226 (-) Transcript_19693:53-730(-)
MKRISFLVLCFVLIFAKSTSQEFGFATRQGFRDQFEEQDFVFDLKGEAVTPGEGGMAQPVEVNAMPALYGEKMAMTLFTIEPCGINLPHVHPRATEMIYVISGAGGNPQDQRKNLQTAFLEENGGRTIVNLVGDGEVTFFPEGLIHYQQNLGCEPIQFLSALNSEDPGVVTITTRLFTLPDEALASSFGIEIPEVQMLREGLPNNPADGIAECMQRCGMTQTHKI